MFYGITDLATFVVGTIIIVLVPGPNSLYVMTAASRQGLSAGLRGAGGIFLGDLILICLAATGMASLFDVYPFLFTVLKYMGAGYLIWLGIGLLKAAIQHWKGVPVEAETSQTENSNSPFRMALLISLMNPKAILFYVSFFIQFVSPDYAYPEISFLILGTIVQVCSMVFLLALVVGGNYLAGLFRRWRRVSAAATGGVGGVFIGFGAKLANTGLG